MLPSCSSSGDFALHTKKLVILVCQWGFLILHKVWSLVTETGVIEAVMVLPAAGPKKTLKKGHSRPVPKRWRCDLLGRGRALWTWQGGWPQPLTETTCSAAAKGNWNSKALPVFTLLPGLQLATRDRDFPFDQLRRGRIFFFQTELWLQSHHNCYDFICCWDKLHVRLTSAWKQVINETTYECFSSFLQTFCKLLFFL